MPHWRLALTLYASGLGSWILFATPETGVMAGIWGLIGYGLGNALPSWTLILVGPKVIQVLGPRGFSVTDFVLIRFGRSSQVFTALLTVFYNVIFISAELTGISDCLSILIPGYPVYAAPLMISLVTLGYSLLGGIRASYATDYIQAPLVFLVTVGAVVAFMVAVAPVEQSCFETALKLSSATGVVGGVTLLLSVTVNEFLNQGLWQRFVSARSFRDAAIGLSAAGLLSALTVILFGFVGVVALADALQPGSPPDAVDVVKVSSHWPQNAVFPFWSVFHGHRQTRPHGRLLHPSSRRPSIDVHCRHPTERHYGSVRGGVLFSRLVTELATAADGACQRSGRGSGGGRSLSTGVIPSIEYSFLSAGASDIPRALTQPCNASILHRGLGLRLGVHRDLWRLYDRFAKSRIHSELQTPLTCSGLRYLSARTTGGH